MKKKNDFLLSGCDPTNAHTPGERHNADPMKRFPYPNPDYNLRWQAKKKAEIAKVVEDFNAKYAVGSKVAYCSKIMDIDIECLLVGRARTLACGTVAVCELESIGVALCCNVKGLA